MYAVALGFHVLFLTVITRRLVMTVFFAVAAISGQFCVVFLYHFSFSPMEKSNGDPLEKGIR